MANPIFPRTASTAVLITGFGPFPGVPVNATMRLVPALAEHAKGAFSGAHVRGEILPTEWTSAPQRLEQLLAEFEPDLVLHFGVSARARGFEVETRACNLRSASLDAAGALPPSMSIRAGGAEHLRASLPFAYLVERLRRKGIPAFQSRDAGQYLCNATLYHSLTCASAAAGRRTGFIHIPASLARPGGANRGRVGACPLTWEQAFEGGVEILAACLGRERDRRRASTRPVKAAAEVR
jgi:pyroglutamyl-peptidase